MINKYLNSLDKTNAIGDAIEVGDVCVMTCEFDKNNIWLRLIKDSEHAYIVLLSPGTLCFVLTPDYAKDIVEVVVLNSNNHRGLIHKRKLVKY